VKSTSAGKLFQACIKPVVKTVIMYVRPAYTLSPVERKKNTQKWNYTKNTNLTQTRWVPVLSLCLCWRAGWESDISSDPVWLADQDSSETEAIGQWV